LQDIEKVAEELDITRDMVSTYLSKKEVKSYIDNVFMNLGFNNRFKMRRAMDAVLQKKFQEMEESETGSSKDIAELLALSHKMSMDELSRQIELEKLRQSSVKTQTNIQINNGDTKYETLIRQLVSGTV
jgi:predicted transcriptional regulator